LGATSEPANYLASFAQNWLYSQKKTYGYRERNDAQRQAFLAAKLDGGRFPPSDFAEIAAKAPETVLYLDESGIDNACDYAYGWSECGQRFHALKLGHHTQRISIIAALHHQQLLAPLTFEGYCNRGVFEAWLEQFLLPLLLPGQTLIMDNASFHKSERIQELIASVGCQVLYLLPYSPDFNSIEPYWFLLKHRIRRTVSLYPSFREAVDAAFV